MIRYLPPRGQNERYGTIALDLVHNDFDSLLGMEQPCMCMRMGCPLCRGLRPETAGYPYSDSTEKYSLTGFGRSDKV